MLPNKFILKQIDALILTWHIETRSRLKDKSREDKWCY